MGRKVAGLTPLRAPAWVVDSAPSQAGQMQEAAKQCLSLTSLFLSLPPCPLSENKNK